jgi:putative ABC transport system ATP-binding protein
MRMLRTLNDDGTTVVMVTHTPHHADYARRIVNLIDGQIVSESARAA